MIFLELFWVFFKVGILGIGGGYAAIPLIQSFVVDGHGWLTQAQFADLLAIDELTPGPIAINSATFVGMRVAGVGGAIVATFAFVLPSVIIISILGLIYFKYKKLSFMQTILKTLRPVVAAAVFSAFLSLAVLALWTNGVYSANSADINIISVFIFGLSLYLLRKHDISPIKIILGSGILGAVFFYLL